ncbi:MULTISPECIES: hypothetical protein [Roseomonadaceae]|uniref:Uncharacterized protein n=1 Tax=Falsiroseomonas oleicola TaxID=2801474 RepID=A0ABS6H090_9PROT|nr:hypothetical protein [Roseomonas oleicola]MBU8542077.1 hypothetical protein [Roseomonas oleicola]
MTITRRPLLLALPALLLAPTSQAQTRVDELRGRLTEDTAESFGRFVADHLDQVISLRLAVAPPARHDGLTVAEEDGRLRLDISAPEKMQVTFFGGQARQPRGFAVDSVYRVRNDGMQMGILIYGLDPLPEAEARQARQSVRPIVLG